MLNLLIIDNNSDSRKQLLNYISEHNPKIRVHAVADTIDEGINIVNLGIIDITLINLNVDSNVILNGLNNVKNEHKYKKSFIIIANDFTSLSGNQFVHTYLHFPTNITAIVSKLQQLADYKLSEYNDPKLLKMINHELAYLDYNFSYLGTKYLSECIALMYYNGYSKNLTKEIYPIIATNYNKSINNIKCNIARATDIMFFDCDENRLKSYFGAHSTIRPRTKLVICAILNHLDKAYNINNNPWL